MKTLGNILWLIFGGLLVAILYYIVGFLLCLTFIGIPFGAQLFKFGTYSLWPFGHQIVDRPDEPGCVSVAMNVLWIVLGWWEIAVIHLIFGVVLCITIVGIPFGLQHLKMILPTLLPFGKSIQ